MEMKKIKLAIGIPNTGHIKSQTAFCLCRTLKDFPHEYTVLFQEGSILHRNREIIAQTAVDKGCTHLLFLDTDMSFEKDAVVRLLKRNKDVIGANYNKRKLGEGGTAEGLQGNRGLVRCDSVATGFMLINLKVFKNLPHPWFFWESDTQGNVVTGEDYWFCRLARANDYKIWCDLSIPLKHIGDYAY